MRIAVVSDTHIPASLQRLPDRLLEDLVGVDAILHAGDVTTYAVLEELARIAPVTAVCGNIDPPEMRQHLNDREIIEMGGRTIGLQHGHQRHALQDLYIAFAYDAPEFDLFYEAMRKQLPDAEIIVFGHFHAPLVKYWDGILFVNPGSIAPPHERPTYALLDPSGRPTARIVPL